jgi:hypothetical protein
MTTNTITADVSGVSAPVYYAGLAPGLAGLYQLNVLIPSGVTSGNASLDIAGPDSYSMEALIPVGTAAVSAGVSAPLAMRRRPKSVRRPGILDGKRARSLQ